MADFEKVYKAYVEELIEQGAKSEKLRTAIQRAVNAYRGNLKRALELFPDSSKLKERARKIKEYSIDHLPEIIDKTCEAVIRNHGHCHLAKNAEEANRIINDLVGEPKKIIVKGKSLTSEETELRQYLQEKGHEVWETDLGEFLVQIRGGRPMHMLAPSVDLPREEAAKLVSGITGEEIDPTNIEAIVAAVRRFLRNKYINADVGMSGANAISADTGTLFIIENEGNVKLSTALQEKHIALAGVEKIVPTLEDAFLITKVTWRYANYIVPSYVHMISGPSKTGDIEKVTTYGAHGPREFHLILLDNGRLEVAKDPVFKELLYCMKCGACMYECPPFWVTAGHYGKKYVGGIGVLWDAFIATGLEQAAPAAFTCLLCGRCKVRCPLSIDTPRMTRELRNILINKGYIPTHLKEFLKMFE